MMQSSATVTVSRMQQFAPRNEPRRIVTPPQITACGPV